MILCKYNIFVGGDNMHTENINENEEIQLLKKLLRTTDNKRMHIRY